MSMMYCHKHDRHYDSDYDTECPECEEELAEQITNMKKPKYTHFTENEITGSYHNDKTNWPVIIAVIIIVTVSLIVLLHGLEAEALMY